MTQDEIIEMAIENTINGLTFNQDGLVRFAKLVAQHEREACALVADGAIDFWVKAGYLEGPHIEEAHNIAQEIRARGEYD